MKSKLFDLELENLKGDELVRLLVRLSSRVAVMFMCSVYLILTSLLWVSNKPTSTEVTLIAVATVMALGFIVYCAFLLRNLKRVYLKVNDLVLGSTEE